VFAEIYARNTWGGRPGEFFSGPGSDSAQVRAYVEYVRAFARDHGIRTLVDLGCGDYRVGMQLRTPGDRYVGVDIVPDLVAHNSRTFGGPDTEFKCMDIIAEEPPAGDLCLVRQVLQHLSNQQVSRILPGLRRYRYVLVSEHHPAPARYVRPNTDKPHGDDTRVHDGSGIYLDRPPFDCAVEHVLTTAVDAPLVEHGETIDTYLLRGSTP
jgi:hypothetical protein